MSDHAPKPEGAVPTEETAKSRSSKPVGLTRLNPETLEAFFSSEHPPPKENDGKSDHKEDEFEVRRKRFFGQ